MGDDSRIATSSIANSAHDFNNVLATILACTEAALETLPNPEARQALEEAQLAVDRAAALARQLLAFSRRQTLTVKAVDLAALLTSVERLLLRVLPSSITLDVTSEAALPLAWCDPGQVEQVLLNLVVNARDAMPAGGRIAIHARAVTIDPGDAAEMTLDPGGYLSIRGNESPPRTPQPSHRARVRVSGGPVRTHRIREGSLT